MGVHGFITIDETRVPAWECMDNKPIDETNYGKLGKWKDLASECPALLANGMERTAVMDAAMQNATALEMVKANVSTQSCHCNPRAWKINHQKRGLIHRNSPGHFGRGGF
jgi:hypothetical protein